VSMMVETVWVILLKKPEKVLNTSFDLYHQADLSARSDGTCGLLTRVLGMHQFASSLCCFNDSFDQGDAQLSFF
jgi:hypothetical protein